MHCNIMQFNHYSFWFQLASLKYKRYEVLKEWLSLNQPWSHVLFFSLNLHFAVPSALYYFHKNKCEWLHQNAFFLFLFHFACFDDICPPHGYWQHRMKYAIAVIIIARRMNWMTHWSIEDNEKGGDTFALIHQYVWDGTKFTSAVNIAPRMKPWIERQWQGLGAIILPFHTPTRLHILSAFSSWRILLPQFLVCRRVNYNPIQAPQTPGLAKIDTDGSG